MLDIDFIRDASYQNIECVLDNLNLEYRYENGWLVLRCMFHSGEKFNLKFRGDSFYCFSQCREQYSIFDIVGKVNHYTFRESLYWLANLLGVEDDCSQPTKIDVETKSHLSALKKMRNIKHKESVHYTSVDQSILNTVEKYYHPWLEECGLTEQTCDHFNVGYARAGVLDGRICFPIKDPYGNVISISGRMPNYQMVNESRYYIIGHSHVSKTLYNIDSVLSNISSYDNIYVVEGFKSVMRMHQEGYFNTVASMGASLSDNQRNLLLSTGLNIVVLCDADLPGEQFGQAVYNKCHKISNVKIVKLSDVTIQKKASIDDLTADQFKMLERKYLWQ